MKRLNRKGFTLVELLAVIVILAIVVGITLVTVLPTLKKSRQQAFELSANTVAEYLEKQYQAQLIGEGIDVAVTIPLDTPGDIGTDDFKKAGVKPTNYASGTWYINKTTGRACVVLNAATSGWASGEEGRKAGEFHDVDPATARSTGCSTETPSGNNSTTGTSQDSNSESGTN